MLWPDIKGKTVLVTGASSGLGAHFAEMFAAQGAQVIAAARRAEALDTVCAAIANAGGAAQPLVLDVGDPDAVAASMATIAPDIVINNAGITATQSALDTDDATFANVINTNLNGAFSVARTAAQGMVDRGTGGAIVNVASILGFRVAGQLSAYAASKAALVQLTKSLGLEWARHGIRVNALCPGYIETPINSEFFATDAGQTLIRRIPQRRLGQMSDLDAPTLLLASDAGGYITGTTLCVDGGHLTSSL